MAAAHRPPAHPRASRPGSVPRGDTIVEALVATVLLAVGGLALVGLTAVLTRDERRLASRARATGMLAERVVEWGTAPCADSAGGRDVGGLAERWRVARGSDSLAVLVDSVSMPADRWSAGVSLTAVRACAP